MPSRYRSCDVICNVFVLIVLAKISFIYYVTVVLVWAPRVEDDPSYPNSTFLVIYNIFFLMLMWCFFKTMYSDPGQVPTFWGFHLGDNESKRRRYCLICNVFKPDRCHHCSTCNRCVLNMDHHCPWVNNCIGFWNRKFFLMLLVYGLFLTYMTFGSLATDFYHFASNDDPNYKFESKEKDELYRYKKICVLVAFTLNFVVMVLLTGFFKFHVRLAI